MRLYTTGSRGNTENSSHTKGGTILLGERYRTESESSERDRGTGLSSGDPKVANCINHGNQIARLGRRDQHREVVVRKQEGREM